MLYVKDLVNVSGIFRCVWLAGDATFYFLIYFIFCFGNNITNAGDDADRIY